MKRITPNIFKRIYNGRSVGFVFVLGLCTIGSFYLTLNKPQNFGFYNTLITYTLICLFGVIIAYLRGCQKLLPDTIIDELSSENNYSISFCDNQSLCEADEMTRPYFGRGFIPFDKIEQWRLKNQKGFVQINNSEGTLCACFVILGLESSFLNQFIAGRLTEHDISSDVVLSFDEMKKENCIYLSGVVVREPYSYMGHKRTRVMLWAILQYIKKVFGLRKSRIFYAIGLTKESEKLLNAMGFKLYGNKESRKDKSNLYRIELDKNKWEKLMARIGDYSKMASMQID